MRICIDNRIVQMYVYSSRYFEFSLLSFYSNGVVTGRNTQVGITFYDFLRIQTWCSAWTVRRPVSNFFFKDFVKTFYINMNRL